MNRMKATARGADAASGRPGVSDGSAMRTVVTLHGLGDQALALGEDDTLALRQVDPLVDRLRAAGDDAGDVWVCCIYCERFFQARHLRVDVYGQRQRCAFCPCAGFDVAIHPWDVYGGDGWPAEQDLHHGRSMP